MPRCCQFSEDRKEPSCSGNRDRDTIWLLPRLLDNPENGFLRMAKTTLLVPVDLSDVSKPVLEKTAELAQQLLSARVVVLHVAEPVATSAPVEATEDLVILSPSPVDTMEDFSATNSRLKSLEEPLEAVGVKVETVIHPGLVIDDIFEQAAKYHADYIILAPMVTARYTTSSARAWSPTL